MTTDNHSSSTYKAEDLQRYHRGEMTKEEMYELEKAALIDPFLSDALDGFSQLPPYNRHDLKREILSLPYSPRIPIKKYLSIAAVLIGVIFSFLFFRKDKQPENPFIFNPSDTQTSLVAIPDTPQIALADNMRKEKDWNAVTVVEKNKPESEEKTESIPQEVSPKKTAENNNTSIASNNMILEDESVMASSNESLTIFSDNSKRKDDQPVLDKSTFTVAKTKSLSQIKNHKGAYPQDGWDNFNQYMKEELIKILLTDAEKQLNSITIRFSLSKDGKPDNINVSDSQLLSTTTKYNIVSLMQKGSSWINTSDNSEPIEVKIKLR